MNRTDARLIDVIEPVRDMAVGRMLEALARSIDEGYEVHAEPKCRDESGTVLREGRLKLPRRCDLMLSERKGAKHDRRLREISPSDALSFEPITIVEPDGFVCVIAPFRWSRARILLTASETEPDWGPLRRWFLEWFQSRFSDEAPDLEGAVHAMEGPEEVPTGWQIVIDLGSAPTEALSDLIGALAATGAERVRIGEHVF